MALDFGKTASAKTAKQRMKQAIEANVYGKILELPASKLHESPLNALMPTEEIEELAGSIDEYGLQEPLLVYSLPEGEYEIYAGHRRFLAMRELKKEKIPCIVKPYPASAEERFRDHLINNSERRENNFRYWIAEIDAANQVLDDTSFSGTKREKVEKISEMLDGKVSVAQIYRYEAVGKMVPEMQHLADIGYAVYVVYQASGLSDKDQTEMATRVRERYEKDGKILSSAEFASLAESFKEKKTERKKPSYESRLLQFESKIEKTIGKPRTEEDKEQARRSIVRIREMLNRIEKGLQ